MKKVIVLKCSPRINGNSDILADSFIRGAKEAGHNIIELPIGRMNIGPCKACYKCFSNGAPCIFNDDMQKVYPEFETADTVIISAPIYYFSLPAQYKCFIDRILPYDVKEVMPENKQSALLMTCGQTEPEGEDMFDAAIKEYNKIYTEWFGWENLGIIKAFGVNDKGDIKNTPYLEQAYNLGKKL